jgi:hypothetical protein
MAELANEFFELYLDRLIMGKPQVAAPYRRKVMESIVDLYNLGSLSRNTAIERVKLEAFNDVIPIKRSMMSKFDILTKYIPLTQMDSVGEWVIDKENDGTPDHPIQMPFVGYSEMVNNFINDVYTFKENNKDMELTRYSDILIDNGLEWGTESMKNADVSDLNAQCVMALIMGAVRAERFCDGVLLDFFKSGCILKWLERLNSIEDKN